MTAEIGIQTLASRTGVSAHTLRYYEKAGLMIPLPRDRAGRRVYDEDHVRWVSFLLRLREGGMGIAQVRTYATLTQCGSDAARDQRLALLEAHRDEFRNRISRLAAHLEVL
ncbi:MAG TPA: MerR family transcriptional regulator [Gemmatimonadetes bacterium]|nr:MerR family transcriptional regulator [Gemmatimonadota bacterium]